MKRVAASARTIGFTSLLCLGAPLLGSACVLDEMDDVNELDEEIGEVDQASKCKTEVHIGRTIEEENTIKATEPS